MDHKLDSGSIPATDGKRNFPSPPPYQTQVPITTVMLQPVPSQNLFLEKTPSYAACPMCKVQMITRVDYKTGGATWLICLGLCILGCDFGCQFIPFCVDSCKDSEHYCSNCNAFLGRKNLI